MRSTACLQASYTHSSQLARCRYSSQPIGAVSILSADSVIVFEKTAIFLRAWICLGMMDADAAWLYSVFLQVSLSI